MIAVMAVPRRARGGAAALCVSRGGGIIGLADLADELLPDAVEVPERRVDRVNRVPRGAAKRAWTSGSFTGFPDRQGNREVLGTVADRGEGVVVVTVPGPGHGVTAGLRDGT